MKYNFDDKDFIYIILLLVGVLIFVLSNTLGTVETANSNLNFAATIVSIILGVIAILYTLIDSSGQRESTNDLRKVVNELQTNIDELEKAVKNNNSILDTIAELKDRVSENNDETKNFLSSIMNKLDKGQQTGFSAEEVKEIKTYIKNENKKLNEKNVLKDIKIISKYILNEFEYDQVYTEGYITEFIITNSKYHYNEALEIVRNHYTELGFDFYQGGTYKYRPF